MFHITSEEIDDNCSVEKSPNMKKWMAQADPPKEASTFERMNDRLQLLSSNRMKHYFKELTTASGLLKQIFCLDSKRCFEKIYINHERMKWPQVLSCI